MMPSASGPGLSSSHDSVNAWSRSFSPAYLVPDGLVSTHVNNLHRPVGREGPTAAVTGDGYPRDSTLHPPRIPFATRPVSSGILAPSTLTDRHAWEQGPLPSAQNVAGSGESLDLTDKDVCTGRRPP